jgi:hypothetical protein
VGLFAKLASFFGGAPARATPIGKPAGGDGVQSYGGFLRSPERNPRLQGAQKWVEYSNATNTAIVATGLRYSARPARGHDVARRAEPTRRG